MAVRLRSTAVTERKPDGSLVTTADKDVEAFLRAELPTLLPGTSIWGEEFGFEEPGPAGTWLVDPVDGTSNYVFGQPLWGVTVALLVEGRLTVGSVVVPDLGWAFSAATGEGAWLNGSRLPHIAPGPIQPFELVGQADDGHEVFDFLPGKRRHYGAFVVEAMMMAKGGLRAMIATKAHLYDAAGSLVVLRECGADVRTPRGEDFDEAQWARPGRCGPFAIVPKDTGAWGS